MSINIIFPHRPGSGGPGSFQKRFQDELIKNNYSYNYSFDDSKKNVVFIVGGTKRIFWLLWLKFHRVRIIYRLDGISWLHKHKRGKKNLRTFINGEINNYITKIIHCFFADYIVYQSEFSKNWWEREGWTRKKNFSIIINGVDLDLLNNNKAHSKAKLVFMEGHLDYSPYAIDLINEVYLKCDIDIIVFGGFSSKEERFKLSNGIDFRGVVKKENLTEVFSNNIYLSLDINPACPNTVIEALACSTPIVAFDTGSLSELVKSDCGVLVPYGSDPWELNKPDIDGLIKGIIKIKENYEYYSVNARKSAEQYFSVKDMAQKYQEIINHIIKS